MSQTIKQPGSKKTTNPKHRFLKILKKGLQPSNGGKGHKTLDKPRLPKYLKEVA